uniref:Uncharacterized protein n=1 Tax=Anopheles farauti TaxID=69004 RepID=A0A182Q6D7_9DIPT
MLILFLVDVIGADYFIDRHSIDRIDPEHGRGQRRVTDIVADCIGEATVAGSVEPRAGDASDGVGDTDVAVDGGNDIDEKGYAAADERGRSSGSNGGRVLSAVETQHIDGSKMDSDDDGSLVLVVVVVLMVLLLLLLLQVVIVAEVVVVLVVEVSSAARSSMSAALSSVGWRVEQLPAGNGGNESCSWTYCAATWNDSLSIVCTVLAVYLARDAAVVPVPLPLAPLVPPFPQPPQNPALVEAPLLYSWFADDASFFIQLLCCCCCCCCCRFGACDESSATNTTSLSEADSRSTTWSGVRRWGGFCANTN